MFVAVLNNKQDARVPTLHDIVDRHAVGARTTS